MSLAEWLPAAVSTHNECLCLDLRGCKIHAEAKGLNMGSGNPKYQMYRTSIQVQCVHCEACMVEAKPCRSSAKYSNLFNKQRIGGSLPQSHISSPSSSGTFHALHEKSQSSPDCILEHLDHGLSKQTLARPCQ